MGWNGWVWDARRRELGDELRLCTGGSSQEEETEIGEMKYLNDERSTYTNKGIANDVN